MLAIVTYWRRAAINEILVIDSNIASLAFSSPLEARQEYKRMVWDKNTVEGYGESVYLEMFRKYA